ncbi:MAG: hypothetical protein PHC53_01290 [Patescibacteria group bacterium]|nr:hypothetical protein [Patescibacteria group bacterium]
MAEAIALTILRTPLSKAPRKIGHTFDRHLAFDFNLALKFFVELERLLANGFLRHIRTPYSKHTPHRKLKK